MSGRKGGGGRSGRGRSSKYQEDLQPSDDEEDLVHTFDVSEKLKSKDFPRFFVSEITGEEVGYLACWENKNFCFAAKSIATFRDTAVRKL
jgi:hypothetical protein